MFATPRRLLNVHEYVSMSLMAEYNVPVPRSAVATTAEEAEQAFTSKLSGGGELRRLVVMFRRACAGHTTAVVCVCARDPDRVCTAASVRRDRRVRVDATRGVLVGPCAHARPAAACAACCTDIAVH
jgi:hypothetical protein